VSARSLSNVVKKILCNHHLGTRPFPVLPTVIMIYWYLTPFHQLSPSLYSLKALQQFSSLALCLVTAVAFRGKLRA
jgi:hypothetical protein